MELSCFFLMGFPQHAPNSAEAKRRFLLRSAIGSAVFVSAFPLFYKMFDTMNIGRIGAMLDSRINHGIPFAGLTAWPSIFALGLVAIGLFFKIEAAPFHWGIPRIYEGAPTPISAYLSIGAKTASFVLLLRLYLFIFLNAQEKWRYVIAGIAIVSLAWGSLRALKQTNLKCLLAYSSISHTGFIMLGLVAGNDAAFYAVAYYLFAYVFMTAGAFGVVILLRRPNLAGEELADFSNLYRRSPAAALLILVFMASLAGIPPTAGFIAKYSIFRALLETKHPYLAGFAVFSIVPGLYYYLQVVVRAWRKSPADAPRLTLTSAQAVALTVAVFVSLVAGLYPDPFKRLAHYAFGL
jgi:NADH-quinone oxidoreductase subunit N